jgi:hypothetical protein
MTMRNTEHLHPNGESHQHCFQVRGLYNQSEVVVEKAERRDIAVRSVPWWRFAFVCVVMFSLVLTLATRTFRGTTSHSIAVQSNSPQAMRQHMDRDAVRWAAPVAEIVVSQAPTFYPRVAPAGPPLPTLLLEENLYNRPPPSC